MITKSLSDHAHLQKGGGGRFEEIDVLRGLAALAVVIFHYSGHCAKFFGDFPFDFKIGARGVELFFLVSGFVIYFTLEKSKSLGDFAFSRFSRLYPVYWGTLTLVVAIDVLVFGTPMWWGGYVVNMTMLQTFVGFPDIDTVFWSLAVELSFYVIMATVFTLGLMHRITLICFGWLAATCLWALSQTYGVAVPSTLAAYLILPYAPFFIAGITFYLISANGISAERVVILICCLIAECLLNGPARLLVASALFAIFGLAITGQLRWLVSPLTLWLGSISYPLYLVHRGLGYQVLFKLHEVGIPSTVSFAITMVGALVLASVLCYALEKPAMRALRR